ncbi:MAG: ATP-binding cassette domain-containing protein, partial [Mycobacteriaceae bacterium]|nr:ATP-binding cassette domain-containing protein [Mycobacteriaceae bacterium]
MTVTPATTTSAARAVGITKVYGSGDTAVHALDGVTVEFERGRFAAIMGPSGSGKSTLLHCLAGLDRVTDGQVFLGDVEISATNEKQLTLVRREKIGFVFQSFNLIPTLTALENMSLPLALAGRKPDP